MEEEEEHLALQLTLDPLPLESLQTNPPGMESPRPPPWQPLLLSPLLTLTAARMESSVATKYPSRCHNGN